MEGEGLTNAVVDRAGIGFDIPMEMCEKRYGERSFGCEQDVTSACFRFWVIKHSVIVELLSDRRNRAGIRTTRVIPRH